MTRATRQTACDLQHKSYQRRATIYPSRAYARIKTSERTTVIAVAAVFAALIISAMLVANVKKRKKLRLPDDETEDD